MPKERRRLPVLYQAEAAECGLVCLAMIARYFGLLVDVFSLREQYRVSLKGLTLRKLLKVGDAIGLRGRAYNATVDALGRFKTPLLLHWEMEHFVVLRKIRGGRYLVHDPSIGALWLSEEELVKSFTGVCVQFELGEPTELTGAPQPFSLLRALFSDARTGLTAMAIAAIAIGLIAEASALLVPFVLHYAMGDVADRTFANGLTVLVSLAVAGGVMTVARDHWFRRLGSILGSRVSHRVLAMKLALPAPFFEMRQHGHLVDRYRVLEELEQALSGALPLVIVDGVLAFAALLALGIGSDGHGLAPVVVAVSCYALLRLVIAPHMRLLEAKHEKAKADESSLIVETLATILTTKAHGLEHRRYAAWESAAARVRDSREPISRTESYLRGLRTIVVVAVVPSIALTLSRIGNELGFVLVLVIGGIALMRAMAAVDRIADSARVWQRLHKLEDVLRSAPEGDFEADQTPLPVTGTVRCDRLSFRYSVHDDFGLDDITLQVAEGEFVVVLGPNGMGKSTLMKCLSGHYRAVNGAVHVGGHDISTTNPFSLRQRIDLLLQNDSLFLGTILENITGERMRSASSSGRLDEVLGMVGLGSVLAALPMGMQTKVGAANCPLSAGQRQRVLLARALYKAPAVLFMDEATCYLDATSEHAVFSALANLPSTKIVVTHRLAPVEAHATQIWHVEDGKVRVEPRRISPKLASATA